MAFLWQGTIPALQLHTPSHFHPMQQAACVSCTDGGQQKDPFHWFKKKKKRSKMMTTSRVRRVNLPTSCSSTGRNCCPQEPTVSSALRCLPPSSLLYRCHHTSNSSTSLPFVVPPGLLRHSSKEFRNASQRRPTATVSINRWLRAGTSHSHMISPLSAFPASNYLQLWGFPDLMLLTAV